MRGAIRTRLQARSKRPSATRTSGAGRLAGPVIRDKTFFFGSYQRWTDRQLGSGFTLNGAPTEAGRQVLQSAAGIVAAGSGSAGVRAGRERRTARARPSRRNGQTHTVPLGDLTGSSQIVFNNNQGTARVDQHLSANHILTGRYLVNDTPDNDGSGQVTPPGLTTINPSNQHSLNVWLNSVLGQNISNEARVRVVAPRDRSPTLRSDLRVDPVDRDH